MFKNRRITLKSIGTESMIYENELELEGLTLECLQHYYKDALWNNMEEQEELDYINYLRDEIQQTKKRMKELRSYIDEL